MIDGNSFIDLLKGADLIFDAIESRSDPYNICYKWVREWFQNNSFSITTDDRNLINGISESMVVFDKSVDECLKSGYSSFISNLNSPNSSLSFSFSIYLMTWNIRRFEEYYKKNSDFCIKTFFDNIDTELNNDFISRLRIMRSKHINKRLA